MNLHRTRLLFSIVVMLFSLPSKAQKSTSGPVAVPDLIPIMLDMDWTRGGPHYGPDFVHLRTPCLREGTTCECVMNFKVISSKDNSKEFADYVTSFEHGKVPVTYEVSYGQDHVVRASRLVSVGEWRRDRFHVNDGSLGVNFAFSPGSPKIQLKKINSPGDCFP